MNNKKVLYGMFFCLLLCYSVFLFILGNTITSIEKKYSALENENIIEIQQQLDVIISSNNKETIIAALDELISNYNLEIIVRDEKSVIFSTIANGQVLTLQNNLSEQMFSLKEDKIYIDDGAEYQRYNVSYAIYHVNTILLIEKILSDILMILALMIGIVILTVLALNFILLKPLNRIKYLINELNQDNFKVDIDEKDVITKDLNEFTRKLDTRLSLVSENYSELEMGLEFERERLSTTIAIVRAFVHDLKTPIHEVLLENELALLENQNLSAESRELAKRNIKNTDQTLKEMNEIIQLMDTNVEDLDKKLENFDLVKIFESTYLQFARIFKNQKVSFYWDAPESLEAYLNKITTKIILHNLFSNAAKYAKSGTEITADIYIENNQAIIVMENESDNENISRLEQSNNIFQILESNQNEHSYSSGTGLYLLKTLLAAVGGKYVASVQDNHVKITIELPLNKEERNEEI